MNGWIGVDLDGTLAKYEHWQGGDHIGDPIPAMVRRVQRWLVQGVEVRVVTARVSGPDERVVSAIVGDWCERHIGRRLAVTCRKDYQMIELWDDRAIQVVTNTGQRVGHVSVAEHGDDTRALTK